MPRSDDVSAHPSRIALADGCALICVDPARVHEFWPHVAPLIGRAMVRGGISDFAAVAAKLLAGRALLWLAWNGARIKAAAVTELVVANGRKLCVIVACGGEDRAQWLPALAEIEDYGRAEGCAAMLVMGRRGWKRALPQYRERGIILEKEII